MLKTALGKILTAKAAAVVAALAAGGVAVAAGTGNLAAQHSHQTSTQTSQSQSSHSVHPTPTDTPSGGPSAVPDHTATPSPSLDGLCRAYTAHVGVAPGKALENPAFTALITAAGGKDKVTSFCTTLLAKRAKQAGHAGESATKSSTHPTGEPSHPTGPPSPHPTPTSTTPHGP